MAITVPAVGDQATAAWADAVAATLNAPVLGDNVNVTAVTLSTAVAFAGSATVTFTLAVQTRVKITVLARYKLGTATGGRLQVLPVYNTGASAVIGSAVFAGGQNHIANFTATTGVSGGISGTAIGTSLLAAGTYTAYASVTRASGGAVSDSADAFYTLVEAVGFQ